MNEREEEDKKESENSTLTIGAKRGGPSLFVSSQNEKKGKSVQEKRENERESE